MGMFNVRKPRGFNHQYIYVDERKEKLTKMEEDAKRDLGMLPEKEFSPEDIRGKFIEGTTHPVSYTHLDVYKRQHLCSLE